MSSESRSDKAVSQTVYSSALQCAKRLLLPTCFVVLAVHPLMWVWGNRLYPIQDLPLHLANSFVVLKYFATPFFREHYSLLILPYPYLAQDAILIPSMIFGYVVAARILLSVTMGLLVCGVVFLVKMVDRERLYLSLFVFPLLWNKVLFKGNFNCLLSIGISLFIIAYLHTLAISKPKRAEIAALAGLYLLLYFGHLAIYLVLATVGLMFVVLFLLRKTPRRAGAYAIAIAPSAVMVTLFVILQVLFPVEDERAVDIVARLPELFTLRHVVGKLSEVRVLVSCFSSKHWSVVLPTVALGGLLMVGGVLEYRRKWPVLIIAAVFGLAYMVLPRELYPMVRPHERVLFLLLFVAPACMGFPHHLGDRRVIGRNEECIIVAILCIFTSARLNAHVSEMTKKTVPLLRDAHEMLAELPRERRLLPMFITSPVYGQIAFGRHVGFYYVLECSGAVPSLHHFAYAMVRERRKLPWKIDITNVDPAVFAPYSLVFLWGNSAAMELNLQWLGFRMAQTKGLLATYERFESGLHGNVPQR